MRIAYASRVESDGGRGVIFAVSGEIDMYTAPDLRRDLHEVLYETVGDMVVDLSDLEFIDSSGLGVLIGTLGRLHEQDRRLALVIARPSVLRVFTITGLTTAFSIAESRDSAWALIAQSRLRAPKLTA
jgi:anti-sigma B factor antagonist